MSHVMIAARCSAEPRLGPTARASHRAPGLVWALLAALLLLATSLLPAQDTPEALKSQKRTVATITLDFVAVDVVRNGGVDFPAFDNRREPNTRFEYHTAGGEMEWLESAGGYSVPIGHSSGTAIYMEQAQIGEAVLIKISSDAFPWKRKMYITYNVTTPGEFSGGQLVSSAPPLYYNTVPVDGNFVSLQTVTSGYSGARLYPVFCDSLTSPSIALEPFSQETRYLVYDAHASMTLEFPATGESQTLEFVAAPTGSDSAYSYAFYFGPSGSTGYRDIYLGAAIPADGNAVYSAEIRWEPLAFRTASLGTLVTSGVYENNRTPAAGGPGSVQRALSILAGLSIVSGSDEQLYATPAPNLLLDAAEEAFSGRAILSTHLFPLCDANSNGLIDAEDLALLAAQIPTGMVTY